MAFCGARTPPGRPVVTQAAIALLGAFIGRKEGDLDLRLVQNLGDLVGHPHVASVQGQIDGLAATRSCSGRCGRR